MADDRRERDPDEAEDAAHRELPDHWNVIEGDPEPTSEPEDLPLICERLR